MQLLDLKHFNDDSVVLYNRIMTYLFKKPGNNNF